VCFEALIEGLRIEAIHGYGNRKLPGAAPKDADGPPPLAASI
jgi:hypothetical protein